jgi:hypothetical protein
MGSFAIDHQIWINASPSSPTSSRAALAKPFGLPPGLPETPLGQRPAPSLF